MGEVAPVAVGLAIGIAYVLLFSYSFNIASSTFDFERPPSNIKIEHRLIPLEVIAGETVHFSIRITGTVSGCSAPHAEIRDIADNSVVWDSGITLLICDPDGGIRPVNIDWSAGGSYIENGNYHEYPNAMVAEKPGTYELIIEYAGAKESWIFTVVESATVDDDSAMDSVEEITFNETLDLGVGEQNAHDFAIEITSDLNEVKEFFSAYPNANTTVYFITTCSDESCSTLWRIPSIVEYWYKAQDQKYAGLRITIAYHERQATFSQLSCNIYGEDGSIGMLGTVPLEGVSLLLQDSRCPQID